MNPMSRAVRIYRWNGERNCWDPTHGRDPKCVPGGNSLFVSNNAAEIHRRVVFSRAREQIPRSAATVTQLEGVSEHAPPTTTSKLPILRFKAHASQASEWIASDIPEVSQSAPLGDSCTYGPEAGIIVTELSDLEARALCAREEIPVFWPRSRDCHACRSTASSDTLSRREHEVLDLVSRGFTYAEAGAQLRVSVTTVQTHIRNIYAKLDVHNRAEAVFEARHLGLLP